MSFLFVLYFHAFRQVSITRSLFYEQQGLTNNIAILASADFRISSKKRRLANQRRPLMSVAPLCIHIETSGFL